MPRTVTPEKRAAACKAEAPFEKAGGPFSIVSDMLRSKGDAWTALLATGYGRFPRSQAASEGKLNRPSSAPDPMASKGRSNSLPLPGTPLYLPDEADAEAALSNPVLGSIGSLEVRLAQSATDLHRAQRLRYEIFYQEMKARPGPMRRLLRRDFDAYDRLCDHLLVLDHQGPPDPDTGGPAVVGTYRLMTQQVAEQNRGFYSQSEFDIGTLIGRHPSLRFLELGRSCVRAPYRSKRTVELLWHGIWSYVVSRKIDVLFGCASLEGTDPNALALPLAYLHHFAMADARWRTNAVESRFEPMEKLPVEAIDPKKALRALPALVKGYLRLGGKVGEGAVVDHQFGTTDVLIVLPVEEISHRYISFYGADAARRKVS
ncbi:MAG: GNAT family N-acyltransferase [Pseudomonadota bacterium]